MSAGRGVRAVRAAVFAAVCVLLAALGHVLMSQTGVPWWALAAGAGVSGGAGWCVTERERGLLPVVAITMAMQAALHTAFSLAQPSPSTHGHGTAPSMAHDMGAMHAMDGMSAMPLPPTSPTSSSGMLAAHLLAALLSGLWLGYGERAVFRILRAVAGWLSAPLRLPVIAPVLPGRPRIRVRRVPRVRTPRQLLLVHALTTRGPPAETAVS
ncbi:hypothetical protein ACQEVG_00555 [Streptomyces sp. CA-135486]|uniref:hypothetical protein n=1 Tax=Streptomyces sp. CA-135486 TaxID=3240049 RepID=UPI003D8B5A2F